jgi:hypothetical protein
LTPAAQADYVVLAIANWVAQKGDAIDPADMQRAKHLVRKLRRGKSVWTATFIITSGLFVFGACSKGLGIIAFIAAFILGGLIASALRQSRRGPTGGSKRFSRHRDRTAPGIVSRLRF